MKRIIFIFSLFLISIFFRPTETLALSNSEILTSVTVVRANNSQKSLTEDKQLDKAAAAKLADIQEYKYWAHNNPTTGKEWVYFIRQNGFMGSVGENLAKGFTSAEKIINAWLNSPSHKKNLLSAKFDSVGIAVGEVIYKTGPETVVVLTFGKKQKILSFWEKINPVRVIVSL